MRIDRAKLLAKRHPESAHLLELYIQIAVLRDDVGEVFLRGNI
jgi:hypothetical protein